MRNRTIAAVAAIVAAFTVAAVALDGVEPVLAAYTGVTSITYTNGNTAMGIQAVRVVAAAEFTGTVSLVNHGYTMPLVEASTNTVFAYTAGDVPLHMVPGGTITVTGMTTNSTTFQLYRVPVRYGR